MNSNQESRTDGRSRGEKNAKNQFYIYAAASVAYLLLMIGATLYGDRIASPQQMILLVNIAMGIGFLGYLKIYDYEMCFAMRIYDKKCLYIVCTLVFIMVIGTYYPVDMSFKENITSNVWLLMEALSVAVAAEAVFRALGGYCFPKQGIKEEVAMITGCAVLSLYRCFYSFESGIYAFCIAIGVGAMMTGLYLRYNKLGANMAISFMLYYLVNVTAINSTSKDTILGALSPFAVCIAAVGMLIYGCIMLKNYNEKGVYDDAEESKQYSEKQEQFKQSFMDSKTKYAEKVNEKAAPTIEARREKYIEKQQIKEEKRIEKKRAKDIKRGK